LTIPGELSATDALPFEDSRRLTGANLFFASTGAVLEARGIEPDRAMRDAWRSRALRAAAALGWNETRAVARPHARGASLALSAPLDLLFLATEVNEWAWCATVAERDPSRAAALRDALLAQARDAAQDDPARPFVTPALEESSAMERFARLAGAEASPRLRALVAGAAQRGLPHLIDDEALTLGSGVGAVTHSLAQLPDPAHVPWTSLHDVPTALVTGSNGKTTTVRLLAAFARAHGWHAGYNCTDGVFIDGEALASGDYSGPAGARKVLREPRTQAAILETARGGILRRGLAVAQADVAVVTNISSDHFGEYGIDDLAGLAQAKLVVAAVVKPQGLLVMNAEDPQLAAAVPGIAGRFGRCPPLGWFSADEDSAALRERAAIGASVCGVRGGRLFATHRGSEHDLGAISAMPLTVGALARYNVANIAGAALAGLALGVPAAPIASVLARFGNQPTDNAGRLMRFERQGVTVLVDYAHNPDGLRGLLEVASALRRGGRLGILIGHAGNRQDRDLEALAMTAAGFRPDLVVVKEIEGYLRGRAPGEIPRLLLAALARAGMPAESLQERGSEIEAARAALAWARPGDVLALPVHALPARQAVVEMLALPPSTNPGH
jgi:cyanophycin synthetase